LTLLEGNEISVLPFTRGGGNKMYKM
jgi:hypothetical protein